MYDPEILCKMCGVKVSWDDLDNVWSCDCLQLEPIIDEDDMPCIIEMPSFWEKTNA